MELRSGPFERGNRQIYTFIRRVLSNPDINSVLDIGAGIRPLSIRKFPKHTCIEPYEEYANILEENNYKVIRKTAEDYLHLIPNNSYDLIFISDVIEHMEKEVGLEVIKQIKRIAMKRIFLFTPLGFVENAHEEDELDPWGLGGVEWQIHRSGWLPEEFYGWNIFIDSNMYVNGDGGFAAVLEL